MLRKMPSTARTRDVVKDIGDEQLHVIHAKLES